MERGGGRTGEVRRVSCALDRLQEDPGRSLVNALPDAGRLELEARVARVVQQRRRELILRAKSFQTKKYGSSACNSKTGGYGKLSSVTTRCYRRTWTLRTGTLGVALITWPLIVLAVCGVVALALKELEPRGREGAAGRSERANVSQHANKSAVRGPATRVRCPYRRARCFRDRNKSSIGGSRRPSRNILC